MFYRKTVKRFGNYRTKIECIDRALRKSISSKKRKELEAQKARFIKAKGTLKLSHKPIIKRPEALKRLAFQDRLRVLKEEREAKNESTQQSKSVDTSKMAMATMTYESKLNSLLSAVLLFFAKLFRLNVLTLAVNV